MDRSGWLNKGEHRFPFEFLLPKDCPASTPDLSPEEKDYAYVGNRLKAMMAQSSKSVQKIAHTDDLVVHRGLRVERCVQLSDINENYVKPFVKTVVMDTGVISRGKFSCRLKLPSRAFNGERKYL